MNEKKGNKKPDIEVKISVELSPDLQAEVDKREKREKAGKKITEIFGSLFFLCLAITFGITLFKGYNDTAFIFTLISGGLMLPYLYGIFHTAGMV